VEFSFDQPSDGSPTGQSSLGSDRLRKAIERNRAKQRKRTGSAPDTSWSPPSSGTGSRRSVANADNTEFTTKIRKGVSRSPAKVSYAGASAAAATATTASRTTSRLRKPAATTSVTKFSSTAKSTRKKILIKPNIYLVRGIWIFCAFLLLRLVFSGGGIIDYYDKKDFMARRVATLKRIKKDNELLVNEIDKIRTNTSYQKKIVRHHLGHIAKDEYLILFSD
jgi:cell division protein FtsB